MDYTILDVILSIAALLITAYLIPAVKAKKTNEELKTIMNKVDIAVKAAEQIFDYKDNDKKYNYVDKIIANKFPALSVYERQMLIERTVSEMGEFKDALIK